MRKIINLKMFFVITAITAIIMLAIVNAQTLEWQTQTVDSTGTVGWYTCLALDSSNNPHISYYHSGNGDLKYARWTGSSWAKETVDSTGDVGSYCSLELYSSNNPHISYYDDTTEDLKYARWTGSSWAKETVDSPDHVGQDTSLALDSSNNPHISYYDSSNGDLKYARWTGSSWAKETVDSTGYPEMIVAKETVDSTDPVGQYIYLQSSSLELDSSNNPHISYYDDTTEDLKYARWTGSSWAKETVDSTGDVGWYTSLELDSSNNPHISYYDSSNGDLKYARWTGSSWAKETVDSTGDVGWYTSLELDSSNNPHISYYDSSNGDLKYARWTGSSWAKETVDSTGDVGWYTSLELDSSNNPHISYYDWTNDDLKYARFIPPTTVPPTTVPPTTVPPTTVPPTTVPPTTVPPTTVPPTTVPPTTVPPTTVPPTADTPTQSSKPETTATTDTTTIILAITTALVLIFGVGGSIYSLRGRQERRQKQQINLESNAQEHLQQNKEELQAAKYYAKELEKRLQSVSRGIRHLHIGDLQRFKMYCSLARTLILKTKLRNKDYTTLEDIQKLQTNIKDSLRLSEKNIHPTNLDEMRLELSFIDKLIDGDIDFIIKEAIKDPGIEKQLRNNLKNVKKIAIEELSKKLGYTQELTLKLLKGGIDNNKINGQITIDNKKYVSKKTIQQKIIKHIQIDQP